jgi:4'-phosphopantetheinyl transferase
MIPEEASSSFAEKLRITRPTGTWEAGFARCLATHEDLLILAPSILHPQEEVYFKKLAFPKRQQSYLGGRLTAKNAIQKLLPGIPLNQIWIDRGVFEYPVARVEGAYGNVGVTLTHSGTVAAALAFDESHPMGLDIEVAKPERCATIATQLTDPEKALLAKLPTSPEIAHGLAWTMKEALSKVLKCGMMTPFTIYEITRIEQEGVGWTGTFRNFAQYKAVSFLTGTMVWSIVLPKKSEIEIPASLLR